ncbi:MAG: hypothetical protein J3K34DRAFT_67752 [Monoraphidium minutum]|nr:MAG: hypothetical protein J3K34DRAFT_67752 [Monoraphidium minutum]
MDAVLGDLERLASCRSSTQLCPGPWAVAVALAAPHFLYAFIWFKPHLWQRAFGGKSVDIFALCGALGKLLQFSVVALWLGCTMPSGLCLDLGAVGLGQWLAALALFGYGQSLNAGIFRAIGRAGVYYGFKLGRPVPWVTGWPFDAVAHPQYVGSALSVWALAALLWGAAPCGSLLVLGSYWTALYVVTGAQEHYT